MDKKGAIKYLKEKLEEISHLSELKYNNAEYPIWLETIRGVVEQVFGRESNEYRKLAKTYSISGNFPQNSYKRNLRNRAIALMSIINTWETLGLEKEMKKNSEKSETIPVNSHWKTIESEFGITKTAFGKRINFVKDPFKRTIIFRDVEHAYMLASLGFSKPAVILAGGVIEELLRLYLEYKDISPITNSFDGYIKTCEEKGLLKSGISRLSDSVRHFRNLVHLSKEETNKHTISKPTAIGAVSSIFTIANDF